MYMYLNNKSVWAHTHIYSICTCLSNGSTCFRVLDKSIASYEKKGGIGKPPIGKDTEENKQKQTFPSYIEIVYVQTYGKYCTTIEASCARRRTAKKIRKELYP